MTGYSTSDVAGLLGLKPGQVRRWARRAFVSPARGERGEYCFDFQDVVLLRSVKQLLDARVSSRRAARGLQKLRDRLGVGKNLSGLRIFAHGSTVLVCEENRVFEAESGQAWLDLQSEDRICEVAQLDGDALIILREIDAWNSDAWYNLGLDLEEIDPSRAPDAYARAIEVDPRNVDAYVNLGRLQQLAGDLQSAQENYNAAIELKPDHQLALYNLGTLFDEREDLDTALRFYRQAVQVPDAHYNLARISELRGDELAVRRHLRIYRRMLTP
jgi:tetratricopeptide (TPR) repeat protein